MKSIKCLSCGTLWEEEAVVGYLSHECSKPEDVAFAEDLARLDNELADLGLVFEHEDEDVLGYYDDGIAVELPSSFTTKTRTVIEIPIVVVVGLSLLSLYVFDRVADRVRRAIR